ncbi:MAG TPA: hypothetical protein PLU80_19290, partial [Acidobacteriota bacterium]|nr:hypothetical protein [Acidobacteriota bacterium]
GIAGGLATQVASAVPPDWEVIGIGRRPPQETLKRDIIFKQLDITKKPLEDLFVTNTLTRFSIWRSPMTSICP